MLLDLAHLGLFGKPGHPLTLGRYVLLEAIGAGGAGVVYSAYDPELDRRVAVKLLHTRDGPEDSTQARERFTREARALAQLSHPNIIVVHDFAAISPQESTPWSQGASDPDAFIVMDLITGRDLKRWAEEEAPTWREIVEVFVAAGRGLAAAHGAGLVHRDFKPHNVMIGNDGQVRVMDFGLVRKMQVRDEDMVCGEIDSESGHGADHSERTASRVFMGTPAYMAPEQHRVLDVDARADQFSFCATLYECLYGSRPFPSRRDDMLDSCRNGRLAQPTVSRRVPGWVRKAVLRGLSFSPEDRWPSMEALLKVLSRDARKRWQWTAVASTAILAFVAGGTTWAQHLAEQALACAGGPTQMTPVWSELTKHQAKAAFVATGVSYAEDTWMRVEKLLDAHTTQWLGVHREVCEATHVRREQSDILMDLRMRCLQRRLWDIDGLMKSFLRADVGVVERAVEAANGLTPLAGCSDAERLQAQVPPPEDPALRARADALWERLAETKALGVSGKTKEGLERALSILGEAKDLGYGPLEAESWLQLARLRGDAYDPDAEDAAMHAMLIADANKMDEVRVQATILLVNVLGQVSNRPQEAQRWGQQAHAALERVGGNPLLEADLLISQGHAFRIHGDYVRALELGLREVALLEELGRTDSRLGAALVLVGIASRKLGEYEQARLHLERSAQVLEQTLGARHPQLARSLLELGRTFMRQGEYARAHVEMRRAQAIVEASLGEDGSLSSLVALYEGQVFLREGQYGSAQEYLEQALARLLKNTPDHPNHPIVAYTRTWLGDLYRRQGKYDKARAELETAVRDFERGGLPNMLAYALTGLGATLLEGGNAHAALQPLERAVSTLESLGKNIRPKELAEARFALGRALWASSRDPHRGHALVSEARRALASIGKDEQRDVAEVDDWLRRHSMPSAQP